MINKANPTFCRMIQFCISRLNLLLKNGIRPYLVFDGGKLPMKAETDANRLGIRRENLEKAEELLRIGNYWEAEKKLRESMDITPEMIQPLINHLKKKQVPYVVAPYEADAQIAYLYKQGLVQAAISEDSDLLAFGVKRVLYKLESHGFGYEINLNNLHKTSFKNFSSEDFLHYCLLCGCDYLPNIKNVGPKRAFKLMEYSTGLPFNELLEKL